jgi:hypothetical protein
VKGVDGEDILWHPDLVVGTMSRPDLAGGGSEGNYG